MISVVTSLSTVFDITTYFANNLGIDIDQGLPVCRPSYRLHVLLCSLAILDPRVGPNMDVLSPFIFVLCPLAF